MTNNTNIKFIAIGIALGAVTTLTLAAACAPQESTHTEQQLPMLEPVTDLGPTITLPPCEFEDSTNCYWDAESRGNGEGDSFVDIEGRYFIEVR